MASIPGRFQPGNQWAAKVKIIDGMIRSILTLDEDDAAKRRERSRLRRAIEAQLDKAAEGNLESLDWIVCRVDGKAVQAIEQTIERTDIKALTIQQLSAMLAAATGRTLPAILDAETVGEAPAGAIEAVVGTAGVGGVECHSISTASESDHSISNVSKSDATSTNSDSSREGVGGV